MKPAHHIILIPVLAISLLPQAASIAGTLWVAPDGDDVTGTGTSCQPFATIQTAIDAAQDGDTVRVRAGEYFEDLLLENRNDLALIGDSRDLVTVQGNGLCIRSTIASVSRNLIIQGFTISSIQTDNGIYGGSNIVIRFNDIRGSQTSLCGQSGVVFVGRRFPYMSILYNHIDAEGGSYGILLNGTYNMYTRVEGNVIEN